MQDKKTKQIEIIPITQNQCYLVNGKEVYKNSYNHWISTIELTTEERKAFELYKRTVIENQRFKTHTRATYKT